MLGFAKRSSTSCFSPNLYLSSSYFHYFTFSSLHLNSNIKQHQQQQPLTTNSTTESELINNNKNNYYTKKQYDFKNKTYRNVSPEKSSQFKFNIQKQQSQQQQTINLTPEQQKENNAIVELLQNTLSSKIYQPETIKLISEFAARYPPLLNFIFSELSSQYSDDLHNIKNTPSIDSNNNTTFETSPSSYISSQSSELSDTPATTTYTSTSLKLEKSIRRENLYKILSSVLSLLEPYKKKDLLKRVPEYYRIPILTEWVLSIPREKRTTSLSSLIKALAATSSYEQQNADNQYNNSSFGLMLAGQLFGHLACIRQSANILDIVRYKPNSNTIIHNSILYCLHADFYHLALKFYSYYALLGLIPLKSTLSAFNLYHQNRYIDSSADRHWRSIRQLTQINDQVLIESNREYVTQSQFVSNLLPFLDADYDASRQHYASYAKQKLLEVAIQNRDAPNIAKLLLHFSERNNIPYGTSLFDAVHAVAGDSYHSKSYFRLIETAKLTEQMRAILFHPNYYARLINYSDLNKTIDLLRTLESKYSYIHSTPIIQSFISVLFEAGQENHHLLELGYQMFRGSQKYKIMFPMKAIKDFQRQLNTITQNYGLVIPPDVYSILFGDTNSSTKQLLQLEAQLNENPNLEITHYHLNLYQSTIKTNDHFISLGVKLYIQHKYNINNNKQLNIKSLLSGELMDFILRGLKYSLKKMVFVEKLFAYLHEIGRKDLIRKYVEAEENLKRIAKHTIDTELLYYILNSYESANERVDFLKDTTFTSAVGRYHMDLETLLRSDSTQFFDEPNLLNVLDIVSKNNLSKLKQAAQSLNKRDSEINLTVENIEFIENYFQLPTTTTTTYTNTKMNSNNNNGNINSNVPPGLLQ